MRGSIQKRGEGKWRLVFDLDRDHTGRRRQKVITFKGNKRDAEKELNRLIAVHETGGFVEPHKLTVAEFLDMWLKGYAASNTSAKTLERYAEICNNHLSPALGAHKLSKLNPLHIQSHYIEALKSGRLDGGGGLSARTVLHHHRILRLALQQAIKSRLLATNPADATNPPKPEHKDISALSENETGKLLEAAEGTTLYMPTLLAVTTGLRRGEILALRWRDVDLDRGALSVMQSLEETKTGLRFKPPKTKKSRRRVTLPGITIEALRRHKIEQSRLRLQLGLKRDDEPLVCPRPDGRPRGPRAFSKEFSRLVANIDIPHISFHGLRHTHATQLLNAGVHPKVAQERLGHSTIATTMDLYSHVTDTMQEEAAVLVDHALRAVIGQRRKNDS